MEELNRILKGKPNPAVNEYSAEGVREVLQDFHALCFKGNIESLKLQEAQKAGISIWGVQETSDSLKHDFHKYFHLAQEMIPVELLQELETFLFRLTSNSQPKKSLTKELKEKTAEEILESYNIFKEPAYFSRYQTVLEEMYECYVFKDSMKEKVPIQSFAVLLEIISS
jgi:hypothetical protein